MFYSLGSFGITNEHITPYQMVEPKTITFLSVKYNG